MISYKLNSPTRSAKRKKKCFPYSIDYDLDYDLHKISNIKIFLILV